MLLDVAGTSLSGLLAEPAGQARGLLVALHGGGSRAAYFDSPVDPDGSLLEIGAALGWRTIALDRPGYGAAADDALDAAKQAALLRQALTGLVATEPLPVVLVGHSLGAIVAVHLARLLCDEPGGITPAAVALGGIPLAYTEEQLSDMARADLTGPTVRRPPGPAPDPGNWLGPAGTWPRSLLRHLGSVVGRVPTAEFEDARDAPATVPPLLRGLTVPVQLAIPEFETTMAAPPVLLPVAREALRDVAGAETVLVRGSGHNLSLSHRARAYHLRVLSFAEDSIAAWNTASG